jgi:hypothetical protein
LGNGTMGCKIGTLRILVEKKIYMVKENWTRQFQLIRSLCFIKAWVGVGQDSSDLDLWSVGLCNINTIE